MIAAGWFAGLLLYFASGAVTSFLNQAGSLWSLALLVATAGTLLWFVYWVFLRRLLRVRRIARIRSKRLLNEAADRDRGPSTNL